MPRGHKESDSTEQLNHTDKQKHILWTKTGIKLLFVNRKKFKTKSKSKPQNVFQSLQNPVCNNLLMTYMGKESKKSGMYV